MKPYRRIFMAGLLWALAACGGGGGDAPVAADRDVPASALVSAEAFTAFVGSLQADDQAEPLGLDGVDPPTSDTADPIGSP